MKTKIILGNDRGMALVVALMLLVLLTVMGLAAISTTTTELQISSNGRTDSHAFQAAEAGIKEILYRATLPAGSSVTVNGKTFNAEIKDTLVAGNPNPDWNYNIYFKTLPASGGSTFNQWTLLPAADQANLNYGTTIDNTDDPVKIRYLTEQDLKNWNIVNADLNSDGDFKDLVYFNGSSTAPLRMGAVGPDGVNGVNGTIDVAPPAGYSVRQAVKLITAVGHAGNAKKIVQLEYASFPSSPNTQAAVQVGIQTAFSGNGWISGFNHSTATVPTDKTKTNAALYNNNGCDNFTGGTGANDGACKASYVGNDPDQCPAKGSCASYQANYSQMATATDSKPAVLSKTAITTGGSFEGWGGTLDNTDPTQGGVGWQKVDASLTFPSIDQILGVDPTLVDPSNPNNILSNATTTDPGACPSGLTYIDNKNSAQEYRPSQNCAAGSGVMIVTGNMKITSNFQFKGLIYVLGDAELRGGTWILGAMAVQGATTGLMAAAGTPEILYSKDRVRDEVESALSRVGFAFTTLSWREN